MKSFLAVYFNQFREILISPTIFEIMSLEIRYTRYFIALVFLLFMSISCIIFVFNVNAVSPSFPKQVILDKKGDWEFGNWSVFSSKICNATNTDFPGSPDIEEIVSNA